MKKLIKITLTLSIITIIVFGFAVPLNPPNGFWQQQFIPNLNNRPISGITFADSLTGYAITGDNSVGDTNYIVKTTDSGNSWNIIYSVYRDLNRVIFLNKDTGFVSGGYNTSGSYLIKTTNGGINWNQITTPSAQYINDMHVLEPDTFWIMDESIPTNNIYKTTNGGASWVLQYSNTSSLRKMYFYNNKIGFMCTTFDLYKTTDGGFNWAQIPGERGFSDIYFADSLTGWKANDTMKKTTNGGFNWVKQTLPTGGNISIFSGIYNFTNINKDTIWAVGGTINFSNGSNRGFLYRTNNGGDNWLVHIPDTSYKITGFYDVRFLNKNTGWGFGGLPVGIYRNIHTTNGGDTTFLLGLQQVSNEVPREFKLYQNYPNPFNPTTIMKYGISKRVYVQLKIFDITGMEVAILVNQSQGAGMYTYSFDAAKLASGIYIYILIVENRIVDTKKMILLK